MTPIGMRKITVADVAKALGQDPQVCREFIKAGLYPFAVAHRREGRKQWCYTIFPAKFNEYIGNGGKPDVSKLVQKEGAG